MQKLLLSFVNSIFQKKNTVKSLKNLLFFKTYKLTNLQIKIMLLLKLKQHYLDTEVADSIETDQLPTTKIVNFELIIKK